MGNVKTREPQLKSEEDFKSVLQEAFLIRCRKNPRYSLRAFARSLDVDASPLSAMLRGKRPISKKMQRKFGLALGMSLSSFRNEDDKKSFTTEFSQIALDTYAVISDWYHFAILELIRIADFKPDPQYIASTLSISKTEVGIAIERLQKVGLLKIDKDGQWHDTSDNFRVTNINDDLTSAASRKLQKQILEMSLCALEELPTSVRNHTSITMAINPKDLPKAKIRIKKFRRELCMFLERNKKPTAVYQLGISLYPVTKIKGDFL